MFRRNLSDRVLTALADRPVVFLQGARQSGKSTLARQIMRSGFDARYLTFDEPATLAAATADPHGFVRGLDGPVVIDEVQACPGVFGAVKLSVDRDRTPGRFLLTGSASALVVPELARSLVGRVELLSLRTLSQDEIENGSARAVDAWFSAPIPTYTPAARAVPIANRIARGGYPEVLGLRDPDRRAAWFDAYVATILQRDVRDLASIEGLTDLPNLLRLLAARTGGLLNMSELSRSIAIPHTTLKRYFALLEAVFMVHHLPAWSTNLGKRVVRSPKVYFLDTGLASHLQGVDEQSWSEETTRRGALLENFVFTELDRQLGWNRTRARLYHFRTHSGDEIDFVLEDPKGRVVAIEVKATASLSASDVEPMRRFAEALGRRFVRGIVLYTGSEVVPFQQRIHALPVAALWRTVSS